MKALVFCVGILLSKWALAQTAPAPAQSFPQSWVGHWKGKLTWSRYPAPPQQFTMQLIIRPTDTAGVYTWHIMYGDSAQDSRPYLLRQHPKQANRWVVDERDGILLDSYLFQHTLTGAFTVQNSTIVDAYTYMGDSLQVEFTTLQLTHPERSGKGTDETPWVYSYPVTGRQWGTLVRIAR